MKQYVLGLLNQMKEHAPAVLPAAVAGAVAALIAYYAMEVGGVWRSPGVSLGRFVPGWLFASLFTALAAVCFAFVSYQKARQYPLAADAATIAGSATILALTWWPTQQCDTVGGVAAGLTVAGVIVAMAMGVNWQAGKVRRGIVIDSGGIAPQLDVKSEEGRIGIVTFVQISLVIFMAIIFLMAFTNIDLAESRTKLLTFVGIGVTAASIISAKRSLKSVLATVGAAVSVIGAYLEVSQSLASSNSETEASTIFVAAGLISGTLIMFLSFDAHVLVRLLVAPVLAAVAVAGVTLLVVLIPVLFISNGCSVPIIGTFVSVLTSGLLAIIAGSVTFAVLTGIAAHDWWKSKNSAQQGEPN